MARFALLENFDLPLADPVMPGPSDEWLEGEAAGRARGRAEAIAELDSLRAETAQSLSDLAFTFREAEALVLARLAPFLRVLTDRLVPRVLHDTLGVALHEELDLAARTDLSRPPVLVVSPADAAAVAATLAMLPGGYSLQSDAALAPGRALIRAENSSTSFDYARFEQDLTAAIAALCDDEPRNESHG